MAGIRGLKGGGVSEASPDFNLPEGGAISTDNYTVMSNPSSGATILTANHNGRRLTKMVGVIQYHPEN